MIAKARERGVYDRLIVGDAAALLVREPRGGFSICIVAADSLVYIGDLKPLFAAVATALAANGLFAFSVETREGDGFRLEPTMRFAHAPRLRRDDRAGAELAAAPHPGRVDRREAGADAPGLVCVFERTARQAGA